MIKKNIGITLLFLIVSLGNILAQSTRGKATYYASRFHGRKTSSGQIYNKDSLTCAHRTLPLGTLIKVKNISNGKEVVVKVNDRGPYHPTAIVDLSKAAAKKIDMIAQGVVSVEITKLNPNFPTSLDFLFKDIHPDSYLAQVKWQKKGKENTEMNKSLYLEAKNTVPWRNYKLQKSEKGDTIKTYKVLKSDYMTAKSDYTSNMTTELQ